MKPFRHVLAAMLFAALAGVAVPVTAEDARTAKAQDLAHQGDIAAAQSLWREIAAAAPENGDIEGLDRARRALAALAFQQGRYDEFAMLQTQRLDDAKARGDIGIQAAARMELAILERRRGRLDTARSGLDEAIGIFRRIGDRDGEGQALTHQGLVLINQGLHAQALEALEEAQSLHRAGADVQIDRTLHYLGLLYHGLGDFDVAREHLERGLTQAQALPDPMRSAPLLGSLARVSNDAGLHEAALEYTRRSGVLAARFDSIPGLAYSLLERGRALLGLGRLEEARQTLEESRRLSRSIAQDRTVADATFALGRTALRAGDPTEALRLFAEALPNYEAANDIPQTLEAYRQMVPLLRAQGDHPEAARLAELAMTMQEQISGRDISRRIALLEYRHQATNNARHIELLRHENEIQQLRLINQALDRRIGLGLILGLSTAAALLAWAFLRSRRARNALKKGNVELEASRLALAEANAALAERAQILAQAVITDPLTGLSNRNHVLDTLEDMAATAFSKRQSLAVLMLDVDHFKKINDVHGHGVGDRVLRRVATVVREMVPPQATLGRYGGEEFLLVMPGHELEAARRLAERIRRAVQDSSAPEEPPVTLSIGVAARTAGKDIDPDELIEDADRALYRAKDLGRNRVEAALRVA
ncbi:diguanylate cyclase [Xanthomonadaceae bacterium XH05]|nr:diguanylate cyclase [Xanthomonadaceae bacterium XH05]